MTHGYIESGIIKDFINERKPVLEELVRFEVKDILSKQENGKYDFALNIEQMRVHQKNLVLMDNLYARIEALEDESDMHERGSSSIRVDDLASPLHRSISTQETNALRESIMRLIVTNRTER